MGEERRWKRDDNEDITVHVYTHVQPYLLTEQFLGCHRAVWVRMWDELGPKGIIIIMEQ